MIGWVGLGAAVSAGLVFLASRAWPLRSIRGGALPSLGCASTFKGSTFTVATYNIHRARGTDGRRDLERIAKVIDDCDIVGLQEVEGPGLFRPGTAAAEWLRNCHRRNRPGTRRSHARPS